MKNSDGTTSIYYNIVIETKRNDRQLIAYLRYLLESWQTNINFQLIIDIKKVLMYMTKYIIKTETSMIKGTTALI